MYKRQSGKPADDSRFGDNAGMLQSIATSTGLNDSGLFELNFRDERYLPFEYVGAISSWYLKLTQVIPQFDYNSISDLIVHVHYTARDGGTDLATAAGSHVQSTLASAISTSGLGLIRQFSAKRDFPTAWYQFLNNVDASGNQALRFDTTGRFPYFTAAPGYAIAINRIDLVADSKLVSIDLAMVASNQGQNTPSLNQSNDTTSAFGGMLYYSQLFGTNKPSSGTWQLSYSQSDNPTNTGPLTSDSINDLNIVLYYSLVQQI